MLFARRRALIAILIFTTTINALPQPVPSVSYSVIDVDGSSGGSSVPTTITQTVLETPSSAKTVSVTVVKTESVKPASSSANPAATSEAVATSTAVTTSVASIPIEVSAISDHTTTIQQTSLVTVARSSNPLNSAAATTALSQDATVTVVSTVSPSTSYYDNGMWHTSYGVAVWAAHQSRSIITSISSVSQPPKATDGYAYASMSADAGDIARRATATGYKVVMWDDSSR